MTMPSDFHFREKVSVGILGATGTVGQKFVELLANHPWFQITALGASSQSAGKPYKEAVNWLMPTPIPQEIASMVVQECKPELLPCDLVFSGLDNTVAGSIETEFANAGKLVVSNAKNHRLDPDVPLLVPDVNSPQLELVKKQNFAKKGVIVTNPNCSTIGLVIAIKPLMHAYGVEKLHVVTMQAVSGAGYPGVPSLDILDNVIPFIPNEEEKMQIESCKILGEFDEAGNVVPADIKISAQCNRVAVSNGHLECVSIKLKKPATKEEIIELWNSYESDPQRLNLPSAPIQSIIYYSEPNYPQPKLHRESGRGMSVSIGRLQECPVLDFKFVLLSHNTIRGAAGGAILNAELMLKKGYIFW